MPTYMITVRRDNTNDQYEAEPGHARFLRMGKRVTEPKPSHAIEQDAWVSQVLRAAKHDHTDEQGCGDILLFVHGYNTDATDALSQQRRLEKQLKKAGYQGVVVGFDWPSKGTRLNYLEDRVDAKLSAFELVERGIRLFVEQRTQDCPINVHILAHSMGAFVVREAFVDADDRNSLAAINWSVSQICLAACRRAYMSQHTC